MSKDVDNNNIFIIGQFIGLKRDGSDMTSRKLWTSDIKFITIGRSGSSQRERHIRIHLPSVSRRQAILEYEKIGLIYLINLGKDNSTLLNDQPLLHKKKIKIHHCDIISFRDNLSCRSFRFENNMNQDIVMEEERGKDIQPATPKTPSMVLFPSNDEDLENIDPCILHTMNTPPRKNHNSSNSSFYTPYFEHSNNNSIHSANKTMVFPNRLSSPMLKYGEKIGKDDSVVLPKNVTLFNDDENEKEVITTKSALTDEFDCAVETKDKHDGTTMLESCEAVHRADNEIYDVEFQSSGVTNQIGNITQKESTVSPMKLRTGASKIVVEEIKEEVLISGNYRAPNQNSSEICIDFRSMTVIKLRAECKKYNLHQGGLKAILIERLENFIKNKDTIHGIGLPNTKKKLMNSNLEKKCKRKCTADFRSMKVIQLRVECKRYNLPQGGLKASLIERLEKFTKDEAA